MSVFETERLIIRNYRLEDAEEAFQLYTDPDVMKFIGMGRPPIPSVDVIRDRLEKQIATNAERADHLGLWAMEFKATGEMIGRCVLNPLPNTDKVEIGWHMAKRYWGQGLATEMAKATLKHGFETAKLKEIYCVLDKKNVKSAGVAHRLNLRYVGETEEYYDCLLELYMTTEPEWRATLAG